MAPRWGRACKGHPRQQEPAAAHVQAVGYHRRCLLPKYNPAVDPQHLAVFRLRLGVAQGGGNYPKHDALSNDKEESGCKTSHVFNVSFPGTQPRHGGSCWGTAPSLTPFSAACPSWRPPPVARRPSAAAPAPAAGSWPSGVSAPRSAGSAAWPPSCAASGSAACSSAPSVPCPGQGSAQILWKGGNTAKLSSEARARWRGDDVGAPPLAPSTHRARACASL